MPRLPRRSVAPPILGALLAALAVGGCQARVGTAVHGRTGERPLDPATRLGGLGPREARRPGSPTDPPLVPAPGEVVPTPASGIRTPDERRICRTDAVPRGWIAVAYVEAEGQCPAREGPAREATAAIITALGGRAVGTVLDVCADQRIPRDWGIVREEGAVDPGRCPGAAVSGDAPTTRRIRRWR